MLLGIKHMTSDSLLLTVRETARILSLGRDRVYELVNRGDLPSVRLGERTIRIPRHALLKWVEDRQREGVA